MVGYYPGFDLEVEAFVVEFVVYVDSFLVKKSLLSSFGLDYFELNFQEQHVFVQAPGSEISALDSEEDALLCIEFPVWVVLVVAVYLSAPDLVIFDVYLVEVATVY